MWIPNWLGRRVGGLFSLTLLAILPAVAQTPAAKPANCNAYRVDKERNRLYFNDPSIFVVLPEKSSLVTLRKEGTPGQIFRMKNCDAPDLIATLAVYREANNSDQDPAEKIPSAVRVLILTEKDDWVQVKGYTELWKGTGWVKRDDTILFVKY